VTSRISVLEHNDNTWFKTGPGMVSREIGEWLGGPNAQRDAVSLTVLPRHVLARHVHLHVPLPYKRTRKYWNSDSGGQAHDVMLETLRETHLQTHAA
jgi:hypothetical protein